MPPNHNKRLKFAKFLHWDEGGRTGGVIKASNDCPEVIQEKGLGSCNNPFLITLPGLSDGILRFPAFRLICRWGRGPRVIFNLVVQFSTPTHSIYC